MPKFKERWKILSWVFDETTLNILDSLKKQGFDVEIKYPISTGKEAMVLYGNMYEEEVAVKIYAIEASIFKNRLEYIFSDPRIPKISKRARVLIKYWVKKEYLNQLKAWELDLNVPKPITHKYNILMMDFVGKNGVPAPKLKEVDLDEKDVREVLNEILNFIETYWREGNMVHGDLSEYNVLIYKGEPYIVDFSLGVLKDSYISKYLLKRDIKTIHDFFKRKYKINFDWINFFKRLVRKNGS